MSAQLSEVQFYNQATGGNATSARQGSIQYMNFVMGTDYRSREVAEKAYYEYLKVNTPVFPAPTQAVITNGQALTVPVTGTYVDTATVSVAGGVVTGIVLS